MTEPPVRSHEDYERDKAAGINRIAPGSGPSHKPFVLDNEPAETLPDYVRPIPAPRDWSKEDKPRVSIASSSFRAGPENRRPGVIQGWLNRLQRVKDRAVLWPKLQSNCDNVAEARLLFQLHMAEHPAYADLDDAQRQRFVDNL